jgi:hypothetical protein
MFLIVIADYLADMVEYNVAVPSFSFLLRDRPAPPYVDFTLIILGAERIKFESA